MHVKGFKARRASRLRKLSRALVTLALLSLSACAKRSTTDRSAPPTAYEAYLRVQIEVERSEPNLQWALAQARALVQAYPRDPAVQALLARVQERIAQSSRVSVQAVPRGF